MSRPRVVLLRGHNTNVWDLRPLEALQDRYDLRALVTGSNLHDLRGLGLPTEPIATPRDRLPGGRAAGAAAYALGERYVGLRARLRGADIVHAAEIGTCGSPRRRPPCAASWGSVSCSRCGRPFHGARRTGGLANAATAKPCSARSTCAWQPPSAHASACCWKGCPTTASRSARRGSPSTGSPALPPRTPAPRTHTILSAGRLVWEKGHQDVIRAVAALRRDDVRLLIVGSGPEEGRLRAYAADLGIKRRVAVHDPVRRHACAVRAQLGARARVTAGEGLEEQFGMVLVEALAAGTPVIATTTGAIPEVVGDDATLVAPGDWRAMADALAAGPLAGPPAARRGVNPDGLERYSAAALARRTADAYARVLAGK